MARTLKQLREDAGLSQAQVAERMGVSQQAVAQWEAKNDPGEHWVGGRREDDSFAPSLCQVLGVHEPHPDAPFNPEKRVAWFAGRAEALATRGRDDVERFDSSRWVERGEELLRRRRAPLTRAA